MNCLHIIITKPVWYDNSDELKLAFDLFMDHFPDDSKINVILLETSQHPDDENSNSKLDEDVAMALAEIEKNTSDNNDLLFFAKEPALLMSKEVISRMAELLLQDSAGCIVPSSYPHEYPTTANQHYFTLKGYQHYASEVLKPMAAAVKAFDDRPVHFFAVQHSFISANNINSQYFQIPSLFREQTAIALGAYIHPFSDYFNGANLEMLEFIPDSAKTLLDIGCSSGEFGHAAITQRNLHVEGIEINDTAARIAKSKLHKVYQGNALNLATNKCYDCVTCLDVLEHFPNPDALLQRIANQYLSETGILLLNLPNIGHWSIVDDLLSGNWDYLPAGTLCNTHLHFFTRNTILDMMARNHYTVTEIIASQTALPDRIKKRFALLEQEGKVIDWESLKTISFKVIARKRSSTNNQF